MSYYAPWWLPGGHLQTIYPAKLVAKPTVTYRRERWTTPDGDFIDLDFLDDNTRTIHTSNAPFIVLFHGLEGSSSSHYARALMAHAARLGWLGAVVHFRTCSGEINLAPRFYHSGDATEINWILRRLHLTWSTRGMTRFYVVGVSLGGNALLRWLGESRHEAEIIDAACAISAPLYLVGSGAALERGFNKLYTHLFLRTLRKKGLHKLRQFPGLFDRDAMLRSRNLYEFDNIVTAPLHGYRNTDDYWQRASARSILPDITVPTLVLNAQNDPFLPPRYLPCSTHVSSAVTLDYPVHGGHAGFVTGPFPGSLDWLPQRVTHFLQNSAP